jgi:ectoine hydroxylase-related dioxygenase (phytanoyl-CoA dioxygenase family)
MGSSFDIDSQYDLSGDDIRFYKENGYIKLKNVFDPDLLTFYREEITKQVQKLNTLTTPMDQRTTYEKAFLQIMNIWRKSEVVKSFVMGRRLARMATELMGTKGVRLYHDQALYKEAGGGITPWHADQYYWPMESNHTITAWVPLQDTPLEMGPLAFAPGSFKIETGRDVEISEESEAKIKHNLKNYPVQVSAFALGDVSFHSGWTFHRAGANTTDKPREVMTIIYIDRDMKLAEPKNKNQIKDWQDWCPGVQVGEVVSSSLNPIIYSQEFDGK